MHKKHLIPLTKEGKQKAKKLDVQNLEVDITNLAIKRVMEFIQANDIYILEFNHVLYNDFFSTKIISMGYLDKKHFCFEFSVYPYNRCVEHMGAMIASGSFTWEKGIPASFVLGMKNKLSYFFDIRETYDTTPDEQSFRIMTSLSPRKDTLKRLDVINLF